MARWGVALLALAMAAAGGARAGGGEDPIDRSIREVSQRVYHAELLALARSDALDNDPQAYETVHRVFTRVQRVAQRWFPHTAGWDWEMHVSARLDSAWSAPGCKLMVGVSLTRQLVAEEAALAFVIGHEIAHCVMHHTRILIDAAVDGEPRLARLSTRDLLWMIDGDVRQVLRLASVSRLLEDDADRLGMVLAAEAGYDPARMDAYFMLTGDGSGPLSRTHRENAARIDTMQRMLPVARGLYEGASRR